MARGEVCGSCMQPLRGGRCVTNSCSQYVNPNQTGRLTVDRGPKRDRPDNVLDNPEYQAAKSRDAGRYDNILSKKPNIRKQEARKAAKKAIGRYTNNVEHTSKSKGPGKGEWTSDDAPEGTKVIKSGRRFKIVIDPDSEIWK